MEGIIVLLIIIGLAVSSSNKKKKARKTPKTHLELEKELDAVVEQLQTAAEDIAARKPTLAARAAKRKAAPAQTVMVPTQAPAQTVMIPTLSSALTSGASLEDDEGCVGGSLKVHTHEGERQAEHAKHLRRGAQSQPDPVATGMQRLRPEGRAELRRAIVMAEILDKPKALRASAGSRGPR